MDWAGLRRHLQSLYTDQQVLARLTHGIALAEEGLEMLASLGHRYHLAPGPGKPFSKWPRLMYHISAAPNGRWVRNEYELWDLGEGWCDSLSEAQHRDGFAQQMTGRGGVNRKALPTVVPGSASQDEGSALVDEIKRNFKKQHGKKGD